MNCLKCGRKIENSGVFCEECLSVMEKYPVKQNVALQLPRRKDEPTAKKSSKKKHQLPLEDQVKQQKRMIRRMALLIGVLFVAVCLLMGWLIFEVLETATLPEMDEDFEVGESDHELVHELYEIWDNLNQSRMVEAWHDAQQIREEALDLFSHGIVDLKTRAQIERLYWSVTREINQIASGLKHAPDEFRKLDKLLADKYFCNFSLFQSLPDSWAIDQIFPIMPIQRLDEKPDRNATLQDIIDLKQKTAFLVKSNILVLRKPVISGLFFWISCSYFLHIQFKHCTRFVHLTTNN